MEWRPYFTFDLATHGLMPADWKAQLRAAALAEERIVVATPTEPSPYDGQFSILEGGPVRARMPWLARLYRGELRNFVTRSLGCTAYPANRVSSSITLNILRGEGAGQDWHTDQTLATGVLFATTLAEGEGGELEFRNDAGDTARLSSRAGLFVCFPGPIQHRVAPLLSAGERLSFPMVYYASAEDQPFASAGDRYEASLA